MDKTDKTIIEADILERLANGESRDDILLDLCESNDMNWPKAETLLEHLEEKNKNHIILAQSPLLVLMALAMFVGGIGLVGFAVFGLMTMWDSLLHSNGIGFLGNLMCLFTYGGEFWGLGLLGAGMIIGSLKGMQDVWAAIFAKLGIFQ